jgi:ferric-dicitrate binding protein FerR (iron transport regulator)
MMHDDERLDWLRSYSEGTATPDTIAALERSLCADDSFRDLFLEYLNVDLALTTPGPSADMARESVAAACLPGRRSRLAGFVGLALAAAAAILAVTAAGWLQPFATVAQAIGGGDLATGDTLRGRTYEIGSGLVELRTARGATVVVEAPARFRFESSQRLRVERGRLAADVSPAAKGFTVITPDGDAVDLGTRFGVDVPAAGRAEIHVLSGQVLARASRSSVQSLETGQATVFDHGTSLSRDLRSSAFIEPGEVPALAAAVSAGQQARDAGVVERLRQDPYLIALLDFEEVGPDPATCRFVQGRWPGSRAAEFVDVGDHMTVALGVGDSWPRLTIAAWVRLDRLGDPYHSLYHTDGWAEDNPGQVHWMIGQNGTMRLALREMRLAADARERDGFPESLTPVFKSQGRWVHLATAYDAAAGTARFFVDGRLDGETRLAHAPPARLGPARIGNWSGRDRKLSGRVDDMLFLGRAMDDAEIAALHAAGTPYR